MQLTETAISEFKTGQGIADGVKHSLGSGRIYKGVRVRAPISTTMTLYVGPSTMSAANGYKVPAGGDVLIEIDDLSKVYVLGDDSDATDEEQTIAMTAPVAGDRYRLVFDGETTDWLWVGDPVVNVQAALEGLASLGAGNIAVAGTSLLDGPITLTFQGDLAGTDVPLASGEGGTSEVQNVAIDETTMGGTFTLTFGGQTTIAIAFNASAADVQSALEALSTIGADNVEVTGGPGPGSSWSVTFRGELAALPMSLLTGDGSSLTGGATTDVTVTETTAGEVKTITVVETQAGGVAVPYSWIAQ